MITAVIGFLGGLLPNLMKLWQQRQDQKHELAILDLQIKRDQLIHEQRIEEINTNADIQESMALYRSAELRPSGVGWADAILFLYNGFVRPTIAYIFVGLYVFVKTVTIISVLEKATDWKEAAMLSWTQFDQEALILVLSYYLGQRMAAKVFGVNK